MNLSFVVIIILIILVLGYWPFLCFKKVKPKFLIVVGSSFGAEAKKIKRPGLRWLWYPLEQVLDIIEMKTFEWNITNFTAQTMLAPDQFGENITNQTGFVEVKINNISVNGRINLFKLKPYNETFDTDLFENYQRFYDPADTTNPFKKMQEAVFDIVSDFLEELITAHYLPETLSENFFYIDGTKIKTTEMIKLVNHELYDQKIPFTVTTLKITTPEINEPTLAATWVEVSQGAMKNEAQRIRLARELEEAEANKEITRARAETEKIANEIKALSAAEIEMKLIEMKNTAYRVNLLPTEEQAKFWLVLSVYQEIAKNENATNIFCGNILDQIGDIIKKVKT